MEKQEKREFVRLNVLADVAYKKHNLFKAKKFSLSKNIGKGGICLIAYEDVKTGDMLDLNIYLPDQKIPVCAVGKVAWTKEFIVGDAFRGKRLDVGVKFTKIKDDDLNRIDKYVFGQVNNAPRALS